MKAMDSSTRNASSVSPLTAHDPCRASRLTVHPPTREAPEDLHLHVQGGAGTAVQGTNGFGATALHDNVDASRQRPAQIEAHGGALRDSRLLSHDKGHGRAQSVQRQLGGGPRVMTGPAGGHSNVLLVHPGVHDTNVHEFAVRDVADRARADLVESGFGQRLQLSQAARRDVSELGQDHVPGQRPPGRHPRLVASTDLVLHVRRQLGQRRGRRVAQEGPLDPDEMGHDVAHVPPRTLRGQFPLGVGQALSERVDGRPFLRQDRDDRFLGARRHGVPFSAPLRGRPAPGALPGAQPV